MVKDASFHEYVMHDLLGSVRGITSRPIFGGWGIYKEGIIFGIIVESELYFKVIAENRREFEKIGSHPFAYDRGDGKQITMSYWLVPEEVMENKEAFAGLMETSITIRQKNNNK